MTVSLTSEIIRSIPEDLFYIDLSGFSSINDDAAIELAKKSAKSVNLSGIKNISDEAAENISKFRGAIELNGIYELTDNSAESLSFHKNSLELNNLTDLSCFALESLVSKHHEALYLNGIIDLPDSVSEIISNNSSLISLKGIQNLSEPSAKFLSKRVIKQNNEFEFNNIFIDLSLNYIIFKHIIESKLEIIGQPYIIQSPVREWAGHWTPELEVAQFDFPFVMNFKSAKEAEIDIGENWRIPTKTELIEIYNQLKETNISNFETYNYWSSNFDIDDRNFIYVTNFSNGNSHDYHREDDACLRLVRNKILN
jgi:hypothetical protein